MGSMDVRIFLLFTCLLFVIPTRAAKTSGKKSVTAKLNELAVSLENKTNAIIQQLNSKVEALKSKIGDTCASDCVCPILKCNCTKETGTEAEEEESISEEAAKAKLIQKLREMATRDQLIAAANANETIDQWVQSVTGFSSQYNADTWSANQVIGPPNVYPQYGDIQGTWATSVKDANQYIEVQFEKAVYITGISIYETFNAGGVKAVKAKDANGNWVTLWSTTQAQRITSSRIFQPPLTQFNTTTRNVRIETDCTISGSWVELDAVKLTGRLNLNGVGDENSLTYKLRKMASKEVLLEAANYGVPTRQWAESVVGFSSQYNADTWSANQVIGAANVYPRYGDIQGAWASLVKDANQFIEVRFHTAVRFTGVAIYETYNAGGVKALKVKDETGQWKTVWQTSAVTKIEQSRIFEPSVSATGLVGKVRDVRIETDCTVSGSWVEIDAVELIGTE